MEKSKGGLGFLQTIIKGSFTALITTLIAVLIFAGIIKATAFSSGIIKAVNQFIKILSVFLGCYFCVREQKGLVKGALIGVLSSLLTTLVFALICGTELSFSSIVLDALFLLIVGAICGVITVNVKNK